jgi:hypothetical protein
METEGAVDERERTMVENVLDGTRRYLKCREDPVAYYAAQREEILSGLHRVLGTEEGDDQLPSISVLTPMHRRDKTFIWLLHQLSRQKGHLEGMELFINGSPDLTDQLPMELVEEMCADAGIGLTVEKQALGVAGGRAYALDKLPHYNSEVVVTLDCDTGPFSEKWLGCIQQEFKDDPELGGLYLPHAFPTVRGVVHKMVTIPGQIMNRMVRGEVHATGPSAAYRTEALAGRFDGSDYNVYWESRLRDMVAGDYSVRNIYVPESWSLTDGGRFSANYTFIVAAQRAPVKVVREWGDKKYGELYD